MSNSLIWMYLRAAQDVVNVPQFGVEAQVLRPLPGLQGGWGDIVNLDFAHSGEAILVQ